MSERTRLNDQVAILEPEALGRSPRIEVRWGKRAFEDSPTAEAFARSIGEIPSEWPLAELNHETRRAYFAVPHWPIAWPLYDRMIDGVSQRPDVDGGQRYRQPRKPEEIATDADRAMVLAAAMSNYYRREHDFAYSSTTRGERVGSRGSAPSNPTAGVVEDRLLQVARKRLSMVDQAVMDALRNLQRAASLLQETEAQRIKQTGPEPYPKTATRSEVAEAEEAQRRRQERGED